MKLAFNGATTMRSSLVDDIRVASAAGFDYLEIWAAKLRKYFNYGGTTAQLKRLFEDSGLPPYSINSIESITFRDEAGRTRLEAECDELCRVAAEIGCPYIVVVPSPLPPGRSREQVIDESINVLETLGRTADDHGVALAFEFLGQQDCSVTTLELADEIVRRLARPNVGLVLDSFHFYAGASSLDSLHALDPERLFIFHINDAEDLPRAELEDRHRLLPGLGILPLREIVGGLRRIGYDRVASVEIFRPEYLERDPEQLARDAKSAVEAIVTRQD
jgi:2-keto-myo-inositol isomerase